MSPGLSLDPELYVSDFSSFAPAVLIKDLLRCPFFPLPYWFLNFAVLNFILKFAVAKGEITERLGMES